MNELSSEIAPQGKVGAGETCLPRKHNPNCSFSLFVKDMIYNEFTANRTPNFVVKPSYISYEQAVLQKQLGFQSLYIKVSKILQLNICNFFFRV